MRRLLSVPVLVIALVFSAFVAPVGAITGGQNDGDGHPFEALLLAPGLTFCSGTLIAPSTILTAGHCTDGWTELANDEDVDWDGTIMVSFAPQAEVDEDWMPVDPSDWYTASTWLTHPEYVSADWPFTYDYGLLYLDEPITTIEPATLAAPNTLDPVIAMNGQSKEIFNDVGYGIQGTIFGGGTPVRDITWTRKISFQTAAPGNGSTSGLFHETWFILKDAPTAHIGGGCGGDSGSGIFQQSTGELVAVHTGGYRLGFNDQLCGRLTALNHRTDLPSVYEWITSNMR